MKLETQNTHLETYGNVLRQNDLCNRLSHYTNSIPECTVGF